MIASLGPQPRARVMSALEATGLSFEDASDVLDHGIIEGMFEAGAEDVIRQGPKR